MLNKWQKAIIFIMVPFLLLFLSVGYAEVTDILSIQGVGEMSPPLKVYIIDVSDANGITVNGFGDCVLNSKVDLSVSQEVTVNVKVYNNTTTVYGYNVMKYVEGEETYDNTEIQVSTTMQKKHEDWKVEPYQTLTFPVTFKYAKDATKNNSVLNSVIEFEFLPFDEIPVEDDETTVSNAMDRFEDILNSPEEKVKLDGYMDNVPSNDRNSSYISNVPGANETDKNSIEELFEGSLHVNINGETANVKIMIKEENVINSYSGNEMVIYMTTDPLDKMFATAIVYRCVFVNDNGVWKRSGDMVQGTASVCNYTTGLWGTGSFNTDRWKAS